MTNKYKQDISQHERQQINTPWRVWICINVVLCRHCRNVFYTEIIVQTLLFCFLRVKLVVKLGEW